MKKIFILGLLTGLGLFGVAFANIDNYQTGNTKINPTSNYQMLQPTNIETPTGYPAADKTFLN